MITFEFQPVLDAVLPVPLLDQWQSNLPLTYAEVNVIGTTEPPPIK